MNKYMIQISDIRQTCRGCPSQWEGRTTEEKPIYIRYRYGYLSVRLGPVGGDIWDAVNGEEVYGKQLSDGFDGYLDWDNVVYAANLELLE